MKLVRHFLLPVLLVIGLLLAVLLLAPGSVVRPLANYLLSEYPAEIVSIERLRLGWRGSSVATMRLQLAGMDLEISDLAVTYQPRELISRGRVVSVSVNRLAMASRATPGKVGQAAAPMPTVVELMAMAETLPFSELAVTNLDVHGALGASGAVTATTRPLQLTAELAADAGSGWRGELRLQQTGDSQLAGTARLLQLQQPVLSSDWSLEQTNNRVALRVSGDINLQTVQNLPPLASISSQVRLVDTTLQVSAELQAPADLASGPVMLDRLNINSDDGAIGWTWTDSAGSAAGELTTPLAMVGSLDVQTSTWNLTLDTLQANLEVATESFAGDARLALSDVRLSCDFQAQCSSTLQTELRLPAWQAADISGENALLTGGLELEQDSAGLTVRAPGLALQFPRFEHELGAGSSELLVQDLEVLAADSVQISVRGSSRGLNLELPGIELINPAISAQLELAANQLSGTALLSLDDRLTASLDYRHDLDAQAGAMEFTIAPFQFSDANPFSSLVRIPDLDADLVAGTASGGGELAWQQSKSGWQVSGPVALDLEQLSGFAADVFFIGFNSSLQARLEDSNLFSVGLQSASISTLDVGLPMNRIDWEYGFDLAAGTLRIDSLRTGMLGGTVEIPAFVFDSSAVENRLRVVLSHLDLATIVSLANYPNLQVAGTISGYLPLLITPDGVTLEEGLVSALNPGGSIRYTPATSNSSNASVQLLNDALSNFLFKTLNAELQYSADGDLDMAVQLQGVNPDMRGGQPINLNVTIADNIPTLLRSLQAGRVITERLEERLNRQ